MSKKLLLADDSVVIQKLVGLSFANEDIEIFSTDNGDDAVTQAREIKPDVILADVVMPGLSGYEVCETIKRDPALAHTPILLLTGTFEAFDEGRAASVGADGHITKPFEAQALVERVNQVMKAKPRPAAPIVTAKPASFEAPKPTVETARAKTTLASVPLVSSSGSDDFFNKNVRSLSSVENDYSLDNDDLSLDVTPNLSGSQAARAFPAGDDPNETTASGLFGAPGEGASDELDTQGGSMALGQTMAPSRAHEPLAEDATLASMPLKPQPLPRSNAASFTASDRANTWPSTPSTTASGRISPPLAESQYANGIDDAGEDPLTDLSDDFGLDDPLSDPLMEFSGFPVAGTLDLDSALDAAPKGAGSTLFMAREDTNATTSPNLTGPRSNPRTSGLEDLTVHVPSADIDHDTAAAPSPRAFGSASISAKPGVVADLDASLEMTADPFVPNLRASDFETTDNSNKTADETIVQMDHSSDPLDFGPFNRVADDLDFAFDVSEQVAADNSASSASSGRSEHNVHSAGKSAGSSPDSSTDASDDSFSSLMDLSESQILGVPLARPVRAAEDFAPGYDVSTSDLVTAESAFKESEPRTAAPVPEPERLDVVRELPLAHPRPATREPITGTAGLFDGLTTGSPFDDIDSQVDFVSTSDLDADQDLLDDDFGNESHREEPYARPAASGVDRTSKPIANIPTDNREASPVPTPAIASQLGDVDEDFAIGSGAVDSPPSEDDRRIPNLSPFMEQQIHETLEKVAWEAFSDLSESIVKQVMQRVEQIAWEVIPQMTETLVREEIRKMKGEDD